MADEREAAIEKLQKALLKLPKNDLIKLLKNTYQAMRIKHGIPQERKPEPNAGSLNRTNSVKSKRELKMGTQNAKPAATTKNLSTHTPKAKAAANARLEALAKANLAQQGLRKLTPGKRPGEPKSPAAKPALEEAETDEGESDPESSKLEAKLGEKALMFKNGTEWTDKATKLGEEDLIDKYLSFEECVEQPTFRSQEVEIPQLDLKPAREYMERKNNPKRNEEDAEVMTPKFLTNSPEREGGIYAGADFGGGANHAGAKMGARYLNFFNPRPANTRPAAVNRFCPPAFTLVPLATKQQIFYPQTQTRMTRPPMYARSRSLQRF